jgi:hypothetical protein
MTYFEKTVPSYGALAQLGERNAGSVEVVGSNPTGSTISMKRRGDTYHSGVTLGETFPIPCNTK